MTPEINYTRKLPGLQEFFLVSPALKLAAGAGPRTFHGVAYSGEVVTDQFFWDAIAFDLEGVEFFPERMPVLRDHDSSQILGYTTGFSKNGRLEVSGVFLEGSEEARKVVQMADEGYPWQLSVHIRPDQILKLEPGSKAVINGREMIGPLTVFKRSAVREVSFCAVGADRGTSATVFSVAPFTHTEVVMTDNALAGAPVAGPGASPGDNRDLALKTLSEEKGLFAAKCSALEAEKGKLLAEAAEVRAHNKTLSFELANVKESLERLRSENETLRRERADLSKASREAVLAEDCKRLGVTLKGEDLAAVVSADEAVFQAFRKTLGEIKRAPAAPPAGAFESLTPGEDESEFKAGKSLAELATARREAGKEAI